MTNAAAAANWEPERALALLRTLHDIEVPHHSSTSWLLVGAAALALVVVLLAVGFLLWRYALSPSRRHNRARREAIAAFSEIRSRLERDPHDRDALAALSMLLRRVALTRYPRAKVAGLCGKQWAKFLDDHSPTPSGFSTGAGNLLLREPYCSTNAASMTGDTNNQLASCLKLTEDWLRFNTTNPKRWC